MELADQMHTHIQVLKPLLRSLGFNFSYHRGSCVSSKHTFPCADSKCVSHLPPGFTGSWILSFLPKMPEPVLGAASRKVLNNRGAWQTSKVAGRPASWLAPTRGDICNPGRWRHRGKGWPFWRGFSHAQVAGFRAIFS